MTFKFISNDKYETTGDTKERFGRILHRIKSKRDIGAFPAGTIGGFIETEDNLSVLDDAWVSHNAEVFDRSRVFGKARVGDNALIYGDAKILDNATVCQGAQIYGQALIGGNSLVSGNARILDDASLAGSVHVSGSCCIYDNAQIYGEAKILDATQIYGRAHIHGRAFIYGNAKICGSARIDSLEKYFTILPVGAKGSSLTAFVEKDGVIWINHGNFSGSIHAYEKDIVCKLEDNHHKEISQLVIELIKKRLDRAAPTPEAEA